MLYFKAILIVVFSFLIANHSFAAPEIIDLSKITTTTLPSNPTAQVCPEGNVKLKGICIKPPHCSDSKEKNTIYRCLKFTRLNTCKGEVKTIDRNAYTIDSMNLKSWCLKERSFVPIINVENNVICGCDNSEEKISPPKIKEIVLNEEDNLFTLSLQVASVGKYLFGVLDTLFLDLYHSDNPKLLFTIEELSGEQRIYAKEILSKTKFDEKIVTPQGINLSFPIKKEIEPKFLGIFICKDSNSDKRCLHKKFESINQTLINYDIKNFLPADYNSEDKLYFFSFIILDNKTLYPVTPPLDGKKLLDFNQVLNLNLKQLSTLREAMLKAKKIYQTLNPEPMDFSVTADFQITPRIILPRLDSSKGPKVE